MNDWINLLDVLCDVLILGDVVGGGDGVVRGGGPPAQEVAEYSVEQSGPGTRGRTWS